MIEKRAVVPFADDRRRRITLLEPRGKNLTKLASVLPEVERFASQLSSEDGAHWLHVIAQTASEYYGQNRNGDHWGIEGLTYFPPGWSGEPSIDRELAKNAPYGTSTFYGAYAFPHHANRRPDEAIGRVELVAWNPEQFWVELIIRLDIARTSQSKVRWVLDRIKQGAPFDVSMGAKVPFDMATTGDLVTYRRAWKDFDPRIHRSPADAILAEHKRLKAVNNVGIYGLSITRDDYIPECKLSMGKIGPNGIQIGVRNDFSKYFDISIVYVGADKVAKYIKKLAHIPSVRAFFIRQNPLVQAIEEGMAKAASAKTAVAKGAAVKKEGDIDKETTPPFDEKSIRVLAVNDPDLPEPILRFLKEQPNLDRVLSTLSGLGIVLKPKEFGYVVGDKEIPLIDDRLFTPEIASRMLGMLRRRSVLGPVALQRLETLKQVSHDGPEEISDDNKYHLYRKQITPVLNGGPDRIFDKNKDLWFSVGRQGRIPLVSEITRRYFGSAYLPAKTP